MIRFFVALVALTLSFHTSSNAFAICSEPSAPDAPGSYAKPDVPYCLGEYSYSGKHTCESYEIENYKSEVDDYVQKMKNYADEVEAFYSDAVSFANCEILAVVEQHK